MAARHRSRAAAHRAAGGSLGTGVAAEVATRGAGSRFVLPAPFTSVPDVARRVAWFVPIQMVIRGAADPVIPFELGEAVASAIAGAKLVRAPGGRHEYAHGRGGWVFDEIARSVRAES